LSAEQFLAAGAEKELAWLKRHEQPARQYREFANYQKVDPSEHIDTFEKYFQTAPYLALTAAEYQYLLRPTLRHPDINPRSIFVNKDLQISSLIDWQDCSSQRH
jgi:hypothetical protein